MLKLLPPSQNIGFQNQLNDLSVKVYSNDNPRISRTLQTGFLAITSAVIIATIPIFITLNFIINSISFNPIKGVVQLKYDIESGCQWARESALLIVATVFSLLTFGGTCTSLLQILNNKNFSLIRSIPYLTKDLDVVKKRAHKLLDIAAELSEKDTLQLTELFKQLNFTHLVGDGVFNIFCILTHLPKNQAVELATTLAQLPTNSIDAFANFLKLYTLENSPTDRIAEFFEYSNAIITLTDNLIDDLKNHDTAVAPASLFVGLSKDQSVSLYHTLMQLWKLDIEPFTHLAASLKICPNPQLLNILAKLPEDHMIKFEKLLYNMQRPKNFIIGNTLSQLSESDLSKFIGLLVNLPKLQAIALLRTIANFSKTTKSIEFITFLLNKLSTASFPIVANILAELPSDALSQNAHLMDNFSALQLFRFTETLFLLKKINFPKCISGEIAELLSQLPENTLLKTRKAEIISTLKMITDSHDQLFPDYSNCIWFVKFLTTLSDTSKNTIYDIISNLSPEDDKKLDSLCARVYLYSSDYRSYYMDKIAFILACFINTDSRTISLVLKEKGYIVWKKTHY